MTLLCKGGCRACSTTGGLSLRVQPLRPVCALDTSPYTGEAFRCGGLGAFGNHRQRRRCSCATKNGAAEPLRQSVKKAANRQNAFNLYKATQKPSP